MLHTCGERLYSAWVIVCVWFVFLCLHIMISRVISIVPNSRISSFFYVEIISHCVCEPPSLHSLIWWWSRKQVLQLVHCKQGHRNLPLCRPLLPSDFVSASAQWWDRQTFNSSFNSCGVFTLFSKMGMACTSAQCVRAPLSLILSGPYLCHRCRRHWRARETMFPCRAPCLSLVIGCAAHHGKHIRTLSYFPLGNY